MEVGERGGGKKRRGEGGISLMSLVFLFVHYCPSALAQGYARKNKKRKEGGKGEKKRGKKMSPPTLDTLQYQPRGRRRGGGKEEK